MPSGSGEVPSWRCFGGLSTFFLAEDIGNCPSFVATIMIGRAVAGPGCRSTNPNPNYIGGRRRGYQVQVVGGGEHARAGRKRCAAMGMIGGGARAGRMRGAAMGRRGGGEDELMRVTRARERCEGTCHGRERVTRATEWQRRNISAGRVMQGGNGGRNKRRTLRKLYCSRSCSFVLFFD
jgi:hypothetical protein